MYTLNRGVGSRGLLRFERIVEYGYCKRSVCGVKITIHKGCVGYLQLLSMLCAEYCYHASVVS